MTDKQIIIDGVDVSGCEYLDNIDFDELCLMLSSPYECQVNCSNKPNCYYKQLKRKEQECEELKKQLKRKEENYQKLLSKSNKYIHNLVDENVQDISNLAIQLDQLKCENVEALKQLEFVRTLNTVQEAEIIKLKQTLTVIKEIVEIEIECKTYEIENDCFNETRCKALNEHIDFIKQILQKIRECEVE